MKPRRLVALAIAMTALAIGTHPAAAQPKASSDQTGPLELVKASVFRVLASSHRTWSAVTVVDGGRISDGSPGGSLTSMR